MYDLQIKWGRWLPFLHWAPLAFAPDRRCQAGSGVGCRPAAALPGIWEIQLAIRCRGVFRRTARHSSAGLLNEKYPRPGNGRDYDGFVTDAGHLKMPV
jgi:hypothetical protein